MKYLKDYESEGIITLGRGAVISKEDIQKFQGEYPVYSSSATGNGTFGCYGKYMFEDERITWSIDGGGRMFYRKPHKYSVTNVCGWLKVNDPTLLNTKYLYYCMLYQWQVLEFDYTTKAHPSVIKGIYQVKDVSIAEQQEIVRKLDTINSAIATENQILTSYNELIKSQFIEMFGDPIDNPKGWEVKTVNDCSCKIGSGATPKGGKNGYSADGISLIRSMNVHNTFFKYDELAHISEEQAEQLRNVEIQEKDVLLNITGASVARCCVVPDKILPARVNQHVCIIRCVNNLQPIFLCYQLTSESFQTYLWSIAGGGATREAITKQQVENIPIIVPPIELQNQFAAFVSQVDKLKVISQQKIKTLQELLNREMEEAFGQ